LGKENITFAGDTTGAFGNDNNGSIELNFWLGAGSTYYIRNFTNILGSK
jgi:hypothetical protein